MNVGLIGFGRLGRLLARHFARDAHLFIHDLVADPRAVRALGAVPATLAQACAQPVVVLCVPISEFEPLLRRARGLFKPGALVADVCSVKEHPVRVMKRLLPRSVGLLGTHPNFGPDSAADSLRGRKIVLCRVRASGALYARVKSSLARKGLEIVEMTPREHDRRMASSLVLTHFIGRGLIAYGAKPTGVDTEGYKRLLRILETVQNDTEQLFYDMNRYNAFATPMRRRFLAALRAVDRKSAALKVAFQGVRGAYSEAALLEHFGADAEPVGLPFSEQVFDAVEAGRAEAGFVPVENSIAGPVGVNADLLLQRPVRVVAEAYLLVEHCLLGRPGDRLEDVTAVYSHPIALAQCRDFLNARGLKAVPEYDTAGAAELVARCRAPGEAAIASKRCAEIYGLSVLAEDIQTVRHNYTRFLAFRREGDAPAGIKKEKTSLAFSVHDHPGALLACLKVFADHAINLTKLESRPIPEDPFEYSFFVDLLGGTGDAAVTAALGELRAAARRVKVLGSYPVAERPGVA